jgi:hypothetical protein
LFAFGALATGLLWVYWEVRIASVREFQEALAEEFHGSSPRVETGREKGNQQTPNIIRVVLRVDFDPTQENPRITEMSTRVLELAREHHDVSSFEVLELHLFWPEPEQEIKQKTFEIPMNAESEQPTVD